MCNHEYSYAKKCPYPQLFEKWSEKRDIARELISKKHKEAYKIFPELFLDFDLTLKKDNVGKCLFHSEDLPWKRENQFIRHFRELVDILNWDDDINDRLKMDFEDFVFVGNDPMSWGNSDFVCRLNDLIFEKYANFQNATFVDYAYFSKVRFESHTYFRNSVFQGGCKFEEDSLFLGSVNFQSCTFKDYCYFRNVVFQKSAYFENAAFLNNTEFIDVVFLGTIKLKSANHYILRIKRIKKDFLDNQYNLILIIIKL